MKKTLFICLITFFFACSAVAKPTVSRKPPAKLKIKEVTVFKDGHVFVLHKGTRRMGMSYETNMLITAAETL